MRPVSVTWWPRCRTVLTNSSFWIILAMLASIAFFHYGTPQLRQLPPRLDIFLTRHAVERIIFILPVAGAAFVFGHTCGLITLAVAVLIMLPRALWVSPYPGDAIIETAATGVVGYLALWMIETQEREKALRQEAVTRLEAISAVSAIATRSLELEQILTGALDKVLDLTGLEAGWIFLLDQLTQELTLAACRGLSGNSVREIDRLKLAESFCGRVAESGKLMVVDNSSPDSRLTTALLQEEGLRAQVIVPLISKGQVQGVLTLATQQSHEFAPEELELLTAIGNQIGVAVENARLYENMRFYARQITQAQEEERKRIAREAHDETTQMLVALCRRLDALITAHDLSPQATRQRLEQLRELTTNALHSIRRFTHDLRPPVLTDLGFLAPIHQLLIGLEDEGIETDFKVSGPKRRLSPDEELALFRIAQEGLNNVRRHAAASCVKLQVEFHLARVQMTIQDDGRGFNAPDRVVDLVASGKLGLIGMHERARILGGSLEIQSEPRRGTTVTADVPVHAAQQDDSGEDPSDRA